MSNPGDVVLMIAAFALAISAHEMAHAYTARELGDPTAARRGRVSLNPIVHVDLFGTVLLPAFLILSGAPVLFGWAKPVPVNRSNLRSPRRDGALVSAAGPLTNLGLVLASVGVTVIFYPLVARVDGLVRLLLYNTQINVILAFFNLLPLPPLDGAGIFTYFASPSTERWFRENSYVVLVGFMLLWITGVLGRFLSFFVRLVVVAQESLLTMIWGV